jgi:hypothetical protein
MTQIRATLFETIHLIGAAGGSIYNAELLVNEGLL